MLAGYGDPHAILNPARFDLAKHKHEIDSLTPEPWFTPYPHWNDHEVWAAQKERAAGSTPPTRRKEAMNTSLYVRCARCRDHNGM